MDYRKLGDTYVVRLDPGDEIVEQLTILAHKENIRLATIQGLGALNDFTVGVFDLDTKQFLANHFQGPYEIVSLAGTMDTMENKHYLHLHLSAADREGNVKGGHLKEAVISATGEITVRVIPGEIDRKFDKKLGLNLFNFDK